MPILEDIIGILRDRETTQRINFEILGIHVYPQGFSTVARAFERTLRGQLEHNISVRPMTTIVAQCAYQPAVGPNAVNVMIVPATNFPTTVGHRAMIVHEAVHALNDYNRRPGGISEGADESAAYVAQMLYMQFSGAAFESTRSRCGPANDQAMDMLFANAWNIAEAIRGRQRPAQALIDGLIESLARVRAHDQASGRCFQMYQPDRVRTYDGI